MTKTATPEMNNQNGLEQFTTWFVRNYPGPNTVILDPKWHAPKIYRAALAASPPTAVEPVAVPDGLTFAALQRAHIERQEEWCPDQKPDLSFRGNELGGECGEALNVIKKLERERHGWRGSRDTLEHLTEELADVIHCTVLVAITAGIDLQNAVIDKFNSTTLKNELATLLARSSHQAVEPVAVPVNGIHATSRHDEGAIARCSPCGRYSLDPYTLGDQHKQPVCDCGEKHGWCGSFKKPTADAKWSGKSPTVSTDLRKENEQLKAINANLMGDDESQPRYTTKRLRYEVDRITEQMCIRAKDAEARAATLSTENTALTAERDRLKRKLFASAAFVLGHPRLSKEDHEAHVAALAREGK